VLDRRSFGMHWVTAAALIALLVLVVARFEATGERLPVEIQNRTPLGTGDFSLAIEVESETIYLTGKLFRSTTTGSRVVGNVLLGVLFFDKTGAVLGESTAVIYERDLGLGYKAAIGRVAPAPGGVDVSALAKVVLTVRELRTTEDVERERQAAIRTRAWSKDIEGAVIERRVLLGMTAEQVTLAWGKPSGVSQTLNQSGIFEQWVYSSRSTSVYFANGRVTAIQTSR
jgi:hypothetical protein